MISFLNKFAKTWLLLLIVVLAFSCEKQKVIIIGLSKGSGSKHYERYGKWLKSIDDNIRIIDFNTLPRDEAFKKIAQCSGFVLTGGPDVDPNEYGKGYDTARCDIDYQRDTLEFGLIIEALKNKIPILGICRGEQILNVALGGSLIVDIPEDVGKKVIHQCPDPKNCFHEVNIKKGSFLDEITGVEKGMVNSNHHQAVDSLSPQFVPSAFSDDGLIEAYEWSEQEGKPFMLCVQWHPERMDENNPLSTKIGQSFVEAARKFRKEKNKMAF